MESDLPAAALAEALAPPEATVGQEVEKGPRVVIEEEVQAVGEVEGEDQEEHDVEDLGIVDDRGLSYLNQLVGTHEPFADLLWRYWVSDHGPGYLEHKPLKCPLSIQKKPLDLWVLWNEVNKRGGYDHVSATKLWSTVGKFFNPPPTCTNLSFITKRCYTETLLPLEMGMRHDGLKPAGIVLPKSDESLVKEIRHSAHATYTNHKRNRSSSVQYGDYPKGKRYYGEEIVGKQVKVFWPKYRKTYQGEVAKFDENTHQHLIQYKDGEEKWTDFRKERKYSFVEDGISTRRQATAGASTEGPGEEKRRLEQEEQQRRAAAEALGSPYDNNGGGQEKRQGKTTHQVPVVDDSHNKTGVMIKVTNKFGPPQVCGITQVEEAEDGYEIYALLPGMTLDDISVSCSQDGKVVVDGSPKDMYTSDEVGLQPVHQTLQLPTKVNVERTVAILTLHGLLYVKIFSL